MRALRPATIALLALAALVVGSASASPGAIERVSVDSAGVQGDGDSYYPAISADGRFVAFQSYATNLHPDDPDFFWDIFVRDHATDTTTLVSRASGASGAKGNWDSWGPAISADGRFVAFESDASNLHLDDPDFFSDIFVRDLATDTTTLVSRASGASGATGNWDSWGPAISADGRFVAFQSHASNLHPDDPDGISDIFVRDLQTDTTTLVSRASGASGAKGNDNSGSPAISADGRFVAFESYASNLHLNDPDLEWDISGVFVRDLQTGTTTLVSRASDSGAKGNWGSWDPAISADGRFVAFESDASNLHLDDPDIISDIFVRDLATDTTTLVSRASDSGAKGDWYSWNPAISADGRFVAFQSYATNLHPDDPDIISDIFVRDLATDTTTLVSRASGASGTKGNGASFQAAISADGLVAFGSAASNLIPGDTNLALDVFVFSDFDLDGMPNDYELSNFCLDPVAFDSWGDPDYDGLSNITEFAIRADPCDADTDDDSFHDGVDACPLLAEDYDGFQDTDGCPDPDNDPDNDSDGDGWTDELEALDLGTNPALACPLTGTTDDEEPDPWPPDFNDDRVISLTDVFSVLPPHFGSRPSIPDTNGDGIIDWSPRRDLVPDGVINLGDVFMVSPPYFGSSCTP